MTATTAALPHHHGPAVSAREIVLVAMDGVLVDSAATFHRLLVGHCRRIGIDPAFLPPDTLSDRFPYDQARDDNELQAIIDTRSDPDLYTTCEPIPGAIRALGQLRALYEVFVVTSTDPLNQESATAKSTSCVSTSICRPTGSSSPRTRRSCPGRSSSTPSPPSTESCTATNPGSRSCSTSPTTSGPPDPA